MSSIGSVDPFGHIHLLHKTFVYGFWPAQERVCLCVCVEVCIIFAWQVHPALYEGILGTY